MPKCLNLLLQPPYRYYGNRHFFPLLCSFYRDPLRGRHL